MNSDATVVFACSVIFSVLAVLSTFARVCARKIRNVHLGLDDWIIIMDAPIAFALAVAAEYIAGKSLVGADMETLSLSSILAFNKFLVATATIVTFIVGTVKISVLLFYRRIFTDQHFRLITNFLIICCMGWTLAFMLLVIFESKPISGIWNPVIESHPAYNRGAMWVSMGTTDILLDLSILSLPVPMVASLHLQRSRKFLISLVFATGALCIVASAARLVYFVRVVPVSGSATAGFTNSVANTTLWSMIEACLSIIAACLPTLSPVFQSGHGLHFVVYRTKAYALSFRSVLYPSSRRNGSSAGATYSSAGESHELKIPKVWAGGPTAADQQNTSIQAPFTELVTDIAPGPGSIRVDQTFRYEVDDKE